MKELALNFEIMADARLRLARGSTAFAASGDARWTDERRRRWTVTTAGVSSSGRRARHGPAAR